MSKHSQIVWTSRRSPTARDAILQTAIRAGLLAMAVAAHGTSRSRSGLPELARSEDRLDRMRQEPAHAGRQRPQWRQSCRCRLHVDRPQGSQSHERQSGKGNARARLARRRQGRQGGLRAARSLPDELRRHVGARSLVCRCRTAARRFLRRQPYRERTSRRPNSGASISARPRSPARPSRWPICRARRCVARSSRERSTSPTPSCSSPASKGLDLSKATGLQQMQIDLACGDAKTKLPAGLKAPATWPCKFEFD